MKKKNSKPPAYYPMFLNIQGKKCVVVGGGQVAHRKVKMFLDAGANVFVISPNPHPEIKKLSKQKAIHLIQRDYKTGDLKAAVITLACTDVKEVNRKVADEAKRAEVLVNVADDPERSDFISPSLFKRGNLTVAVSTAGVSPALAKKIRTKLEKSFGEEYASLLSLIGEIRSTLKEKEYRVGTEAWQEALDLDLLIQVLRSDQRKRAKAILLTKLQVPKRKT
jgi:precorrin-2 dehydrogenase/sirohydrochlorin ferrochelatase